jgi:hypothetical protein
MARAGLASPMFEGAPALGVVSDGLAAAMQLVFIGEQALQTHGAASMKLAVANSQFSAKAIAEAIGKAG